MGKLRELDSLFFDYGKLKKQRGFRRNSMIDIYETDEGVAEKIKEGWKRYERNKLVDEGLAGLRYRGRYSVLDYRKYVAQSNKGLIYKVVGGDVLYRDKYGVVWGEVDEVKHLSYVMKWRLGGSKKDKVLHYLRKYWFWGAIGLLLFRLLKRISGE